MRRPAMPRPPATPTIPAASAWRGPRGALKRAPLIAPAMKVVDEKTCQDRGCDERV